MIATAYLKAFAAAALLAVGFLAGSGWQKATTAQVRQQFADYRAKQARLDADARQQALEAERAATAREQTLQAQIDTLDQDTRHAQAARDTARADADRAHQRLRIALDTIRHARAGDPPGANPPASTVGPRQCGADPLDLLTELLDRHTQQLVRVSSYADNLRAAGVACERAYDLARAEFK